MTGLGRALHSGLRGAVRSAGVRSALRVVYAGQDRGVVPPPVTEFPGA